MDNIGGAEIVGLTLAKELKADFYSTNIDREKIKKMGFSNINLISIGKIPINAPLRQQLALLRFRMFDLKKKYDFYIIDGDWAMSGAVNNRPNLWFVHSPIREIWDAYDYVRNKVVPWFARWPFDIWVYFNRYLNKKYIKSVEKIACNSINTQNRIRKFLNREAVVINPPIETSNFDYKKNGDFWLSVNRLFAAKRIDIQMKAFEKLPNEKLVIVGSYERSKHFRQYLRYLKRIKPKNVKILSWVDSKKLRELYSNCRGFIATSMDEDFGMAPVEAMASGKPVIAPNEGGYKETIIAGKTGILIDNINEDKLAEAIKILGKNPEKYKNACLKQAKNFDTKVFIKKIRKLIDK